MFPGSIFPHAVFPSLDFPDLSGIAPTPGWPFPYVVFPDVVFPTRDFPNGVGVVVVVTPYFPPTSTPYRDDDAYLYQSPSIVDLIQQTNEFVAVTFSRLPNDSRLTAEEGSAALLTPLGWTEKNEGSERRKNRTCNYQLTLAYLAEEVETAHQEADRLVAVVSNALLGGTNAGIAYGGFTLPWRNTIGGGSLDASSHPEYRVTMRGSFSYSYDVGAMALRTTVSQA